MLYAQAFRIQNRFINYFLQEPGAVFGQIQPYFTFNLSCGELNPIGLASLLKSLQQSAKSVD
jgi:hypothetical protein